MINRPVRERPVDEILDAAEQALANTGYEEIGLLSLSSSDYTHILELVNAISERFSGKHVNISLPSLRIESFSVDLMDALKDSRRSGFTLAPEAATERMREIINKPVQTQTDFRHCACHLFPRLAQYQVVLYDWPPLRNPGRCTGDHRSVQSGIARRQESDRQPRPGDRRGKHFCPQTAHALPMGSLRYRASKSRLKQDLLRRSCAALA